MSGKCQLRRCYLSSIRWSVGSNRCENRGPGGHSTVVHGTVITAVDNGSRTRYRPVEGGPDAPYQVGNAVAVRGSATATCNNGKWIISDAVCAVPSSTDCPTRASISWGAGCSAPIQAGAEGTRRVLTSSAGYEGSAVYVCERTPYRSGGVIRYSQNVSWRLQSGSTCTKICTGCRGFDYSWEEVLQEDIHRAGIRRPVPTVTIGCGPKAVAKSCLNTKVTVTESSGAIRGSATLKCEEIERRTYGFSPYKSIEWVVQSSSCKKYCASETKIWTAGGTSCRGTVPDTVYGEYGDAEDNDGSDGGTGVKSFYCDIGGRWREVYAGWCS